MSVESFADYVSCMRIARGHTLRGMAKRLNISAAYYSDIEKGRRSPPGLEKLELIAGILNMNAEEKNRMFDLAGRACGRVALDIAEYVTAREYVSRALRAARDADAGRAEWEAFLKLLDGSRDDRQ